MAKWRKYPFYKDIFYESFKIKNSFGDNNLN